MVKFKVTCSIADISTLKMCCTWERREVASFLRFIEGIINSFPSMKSLYSKKGAEQDPKGQSVCSELPPVCALTVTSHSRTLVPLVPLHSMHEEMQLHIPGQDVAPSQVKSENLSFPSVPGGMDTAKHRPCFGKTLGRVWQCLCAGHQSLASPAHQECGRHRGTSWKRKENWIKHNSLKSGLRRLCLTGDQLLPECSS